MKIVVMAGGKGTRISSLNSEVPKPMIPIAGKPILEHQVLTLKKQGFTEFVFVIGYLGDIIKEYFGNGEKWDVSIQYVIEENPLGTAGALYYLKELVSGDFLLINGDIIFDIDVNRFYAYHQSCHSLATIFTHPNDHPYDSGIIMTEADGKVTRWLHKESERQWYKNRVNAGIHMCSAELLKMDLFDFPHKLDLDRDVLRKLIDSESLYAYDSPEYVKDMGTPERFFEVEKDIKSGKVSLRNLDKKQKAIFIDRDGTINRYVGFLRNIDEFELIDGVSEAIGKANKSEYLVIVITNQPVVARGEVSIDELIEIHNKMETLLGQNRAFIDAIYVCPHHPDSGYEGEVKALKIKCECRKPAPGMLLQAAADFNIDLEKSWMIGDSDNDILAGKGAGCRTIKIGEDGECCDLLEAVETILNL